MRKHVLQPRKRGNKLLYEMVRQTITDRVNKGIYKPDVALPSVQGFVAELGVSAITICRALTDLQNAGLLRAVPGLGTFVNSSRRFVRHLNRVRDLCMARSKKPRISAEPRPFSPCRWSSPARRTRFSAILKSRRANTSASTRWC